VRVLLIPEDFRHDQYMLTPIFKQLYSWLGWQNAKVITCTDPLLGGVEEALKFERLSEIFERYDGMIDHYILCIDRDGNQNRVDRLTKLRGRCAVDGRKFLTIAAIEEIEVWVLAGNELPKDWVWLEIRADPHPKERYFDVLSKARSLTEGPGRGRKALGESAAKNILRITQLCNEEFDPLIKEIKATVNVG
jgi:hypothetical protein